MTNFVEVHVKCPVTEHVELLLCLPHEDVERYFHIGQLIMYMIHECLNTTKRCLSQRQTQKERGVTDLVEGLGEGAWSGPCDYAMFRYSGWNSVSH